MARFKSFANGGTLLPADLNSIEDDYEYAFSTYKMVGTSKLFGYFQSSLAAGTYVLLDGNATAILITNSTVNQMLFYFDPADYAVSGRTTKLRTRASLSTSATAPGTSFTVGLYPLTAITSSAFTVGTVVSGSTVLFTTPAGNSLNQGNSGDFTAPAAGYYALGVVVAGTTVGSSAGVNIRGDLQARQV